MSLLFSRVMKQAILTFDRSNSGKILTNIKTLKELIDELTISDLEINKELVSEDSFNNPDKAPCTFVKIFENNQIAMSVFILKGDYQMPLHDHPLMHGILKVLTGKVLIQTYNKINGDSDLHPTYDPNESKIEVTKENPITMDCRSKSAILTPTESNYHEITAINKVAAFFDILSPPYDADIPIYGPRSCNFYKKNFIGNCLNGKPIWFLQKIPAPDSYYCDTGYYKMPPFLYDYVQDSSESDVN